MPIPVVAPGLDGRPEVAFPGALALAGSFAEEWALVRATAAADGSRARILDGHLNALERLRLWAPEPLRGAELAAVANGTRRLGTWGADPLPEEGEPARLVASDGGERLVGTKVFCSGAGIVDRALVAASDAESRPRLVYVDLREDIEIDRGWYRAEGLRASESHRVVFHGAPVLARIGGVGELTRDPEFSRDAIRTAACWAGLADAALGAALGELAIRGHDGDLSAWRAGTMLSARATIDRWLDAAAARADADPSASLADFSVQLRLALSDACRTILREAAEACGSRPLARAGRLDEARRDLELFLLQHRLDPMVARMGRRAIEARRR